MVKLLTSVDSKNILVAEDTRINQKVFQRIVLKCGHNPCIKENGQEALNVYTNEHFDLLITDIMMPIMDGIELIKNIRSLNDDRANVYIIAASADSSDTNRQACMDAGANVFVSKPIDSKLFSELIHKAFQSSNEAVVKHEVSFTPHINMSIIEEIAEDDLEVLFEISESILNGVRTELECFEKAVEEKDFRQISMNAHRIKGNLSQIGENTVTKLAVRLEDFSKVEDIDSINRLSGHFVTCVNLVLKCLEEYLTSK